jgi:hypothetical protein
VLLGADVPFVLRPVEHKGPPANDGELHNGKYYGVKGTAYVHVGLMSGEAMELFDAGQKERTTILVV